MQWLLVIIAEIVQKAFVWFVQRGIKSAAVFLTYAASMVALFTAFLAIVWGAIGAVSVASPVYAGFILSMLPVSTSLIVSAYLSVLVSKRVYDWHIKILTMKVASMNSMNY